MAEDAMSPKRPQNPVWRMMGVPNIRWKLPSRNWLIFLSVTGAFASAVIYDRREKKLQQQKWCRMVSHIADEPLPVNRLPRRITIYMSAPPGDSLRSARDYFKDFVQPILVAGAMDWDLVEGRREGDVRARVAIKIREQRRKAGEPSADQPEQNMLSLLRQQARIEEFPGLKGDLVIGRNTWKEYMRGLHEGWLGSLDAPLEPEGNGNVKPPESNGSEDESSPTASTTSPKPKTDKPPSAPSPYISTSAYSSASLPPSLPRSLDPSIPLPFPHILGFLNTPVRIYRFLNKRKLADSVGRNVAAIILASQTRLYEQEENDDLQSPKGVDIEAETNAVRTNVVYEQAKVLEEEEKDWHKSIQKPLPEGQERERVWLNPVVVDPRLANRMSRFVVKQEEEERAERIARREEGVLGGKLEDEMGWWEYLKKTMGYEEEGPRPWETVGDVSNESV